MWLMLKKALSHNGNSIISLIKFGIVEYYIFTSYVCRFVSASQLAKLYDNKNTTKCKYYLAIYIS